MQCPEQLIYYIQSGGSGKEWQKKVSEVKMEGIWKKTTRMTNSYEA